MNKERQQQVKKFEMRLRAMCHRKKCSTPLECPRFCSCGNNERLHPGTAAMWMIATQLNDVYAYLVSWGHNSMIEYQLTKAIGGLEIASYIFEQHRMGSTTFSNKALRLLMMIKRFADDECQKIRGKEGS